MERKGTAVVTAELVAKGLRTAGATAREEQVLRMRHGAALEREAPLPSQAEAGSELADELELIELSLLRALKHRAAQARAQAPKPAKSAAKSRIVAALKTKKK